MRKAKVVHLLTRKAAKRSLKRGFARCRETAPVRCRRVHVARPSSAREILDFLGISASEVRAALKAIDA
jgi:hypothetical protein